MKKSRIVRLNQLEHIQNEVRILSRLRCPFVNELYAVFQDDNCLYLLLEYIPGGELFSHLRSRRKFDLSLYQFYTVEVACALKYMHDLRIAYRDIKPENILLSKDGHIRLTDFGFAKIVEDRTFTLCGTPEYLAPETIQGTGHGTSVDWWALGVLLFEMSMGFPPFYGDNPFTVYRKILSGIIAFPQGVSTAAAHTPTKKAIQGFLTQSRTSRLGCGKGGFETIKSHSFFRNIDFSSAMRQLITPPLVPTVIGEGDSSNFDHYPDEAVEESGNLTLKERLMFNAIDEILERPSKA